MSEEEKKSQDRILIKRPALNGIWAAWLLCDMAETRKLYPSLTNSTEFLKIHNILLLELDNALKHDYWQSIRSIYKRPDIINNALPEYLLTIYISGLMDYFQESKDNIFNELNSEKCKGLINRFNKTFPLVSDGIKDILPPISDSWLLR